LLRDLTRPAAATIFRNAILNGPQRLPQARALLDAWVQQPHTIVPGDLNALPDSREMQLLRGARLLDAITSSGTNGKGLTFRSDGLDRHIAYIYHSPDRIARNFHVNPNQALDHATIAVTLTAK
jgi:endonuclease/exonuclease/phosphatase family metal-dependent hydrolase